LFSDLYKVVITLCYHFYATENLTGIWHSNIM